MINPDMSTPFKNTNEIDKPFIALKKKRIVVRMRNSKQDTIMNTSTDS